MSIENTKLDLGDGIILEGMIVSRILTNVIDRACIKGFPNDMSLTQFQDYIRGLYPEYYKKIGDEEKDSEADSE